MSDPFFQDLLDAGLLVDVGDAPDRIDFLKGAAADLADTLATPKGGQAAVLLTLIGLDPEAPEDDPAFDQVAEVVVAHWPTYRNAFRDGTPRQVLRTVALEAVRQAAESNSRTASAVWYTAASELPSADLGRARNVIERMVMRIGESVEREAAAAWGRVGVGSAFRMPARTSASAAQFKASSITAQSLESTFQEALDADISSLKTTGYQVSHNPQAWANAFAPKLAAAVATAVNEGVSLVVTSLNDAGLLSADGIKMFAEETGDRVRAAVAAAAVASAGQELRTKLLWWRETLYSPILRQSYRDLDAPRAAIAIATDAYRLVPTPAPQAVEYLVREAVREAVPNQDTIAGDEFASLASTHRDVWEGVYDFNPPIMGSRSLLLTAALHDGDRTRLLGRFADTEATLADHAAHVFRDLHAARSATPTTS